MTDRDFDQLLYQGADQLPPESVEQASPDPWRRALTLICWGMALTTCIFHFGILDYVLPALGTMLLCLGFRSLRRTNGWFRFAYVLTSLLAVVRLSWYVLLATPLATGVTDRLDFLLGIGIALCVWLVYFALWLGLRSVARHAGQPAKAACAGGLVIWYSVLFVLGLLQASSTFLIVLLLFIWLIIIVRLVMLSTRMDEAGYAIQPAPVRLSNGKVLIVSLGITLLAVLACTFFFNRYPPPQAAPAQQETGQEELRLELRKMGFPEEVLSDLTDEEVALLEGAQDVQVASDPVSSPDEYGYGYEVGQVSSHFIQVQLPDDQVRYFIWFSWEDEPKYRLRECLDIITASHDQAIADLSSLQGRIMWEEDGQLYQSPLSGACQSWTEDTFFGPHRYEGYELDFSLPRQGENIRFYVTYTAQILPFEQFVNFNADARYTHQEGWLCYPWEPAEYQGWVFGHTHFPTHQAFALFRFREGAPDDAATLPPTWQ